MKLTIPNHKAPSWNKAYAGQHWAKRKRIVDEIHWLVRAAIPADAKRYEGPVHITVTAYMPRPIDADNLPAKIYVDGLCGRLLIDDAPQWVRSVTTRSLKGQPRVEIEIERA